MKTTEVPILAFQGAVAFEAAKKWLDENQPNFHTTSNYVIVADDGKVEQQIGRICHRSISESSTKKGTRACVGTEIGLRRRSEQPTHQGPGAYRQALTWDVADPFLKWFLHESYMSPFIINRDDIEFVKNKGIIVTADVAAPLLQNIMIVSRHFYEIRPECFEKWNELTANGIDPLFAYLCTFCTGYSAYGAKEQSAVVSYWGHRAHILSTLPACLKALNGEIGNMCSLDFSDTSNHYRNSTAYSGGVKFFHNHGDGLPDNYATYGLPTPYRHFVYQLMDRSSFKDALKVHRQGGDAPDLYKPPNPFVKVEAGITKPQNDEVSYKEFYDFVVPWFYRAWLNKEFEE